MPSQDGNDDLGYDPNNPDYDEGASQYLPSSAQRAPWWDERTRQYIYWNEHTQEYQQYDQRTQQWLRWGESSRQRSVADSAAPRYSQPTTISTTPASTYAHGFPNPSFQITTATHLPRTSASSSSIQGPAYQQMTSMPQPEPTVSRSSVTPQHYDVRTSGPQQAYAYSYAPTSTVLAPSYPAQSDTTARVNVPEASLSPPPAAQGNPQTVVKTNRSKRTSKTERKSFSCPQPNCPSLNANFTRQADLNRHLQTVHLEEREKPFPCHIDKCPRSAASRGFTRRDHLIEHLRSAHQLNIPKRKPGQRSARGPIPSPTQPDSPPYAEPDSNEDEYEIDGDVSPGLTSEHPGIRARQGYHDDEDDEGTGAGQAAVGPVNF